MLFETNINDCFSKLLKCKDLLFVQDIDGVCIPLVKDPLERIIDLNYLEAAKSINNIFYILTNGEHQGPRGLNQLIESSLTFMSNEHISPKIIQSN